MQQAPSRPSYWKRGSKTRAVSRLGKGRVSKWFNMAGLDHQKPMGRKEKNCQERGEGRKPSIPQTRTKKYNISSQEEGGERGKRRGIQRRPKKKTKGGGRGCCGGGGGGYWGRAKTRVLF